MARAANRDPRPALETGVLPVVALRRSGVPLWAIVAGMAAAAILLFSVLEGKRRAASAPSVAPGYSEEAGVPAPAGPLYIPPEPPPPAPPPPTPPPPSPPPRIVYVPRPAPILPPVIVPPPARIAGSAAPALVIDTTGGDAPAAAGENAEAPPAASALATAAARATILRHRPTTVPQGTLIPAVLETALDSTRAGPARALVSRDVRGFDGGRVLIPRGSRLVGDYRADLQPGQNRALVTWTRLVRPDGATIAIGSPSADTLGRVGIRGTVNSHFFERFGSAILQSVLDVGVNLASRYGNGNSAVIVALPGATQTAAAPLTSGNQVQPTLRVAQGTAITVFVARDLDFTSVEAGR